MNNRGGFFVNGVESKGFIEMLHYIQQDKLRTDFLQPITHNILTFKSFTLPS